MATYFKLDEFDKTTIEEISTFSGYPAPQVREILELTFIRQIESYLTNGTINIPFIGKMNVKFDGDEFVAGTRVAKVSTEFTPTDILKRIIGDIEDGESDIIQTLMMMKLKSDLQSKF